MRLCFHILLLSALLIGGAGDAFAQSRTSNTVKKERQDENKKINQTKKKLDANRRQISQKVNDLNALGAKINETSAEISRQETTLNGIQGRISIVNDSIALLSAEIAKLKDSSRKSLREARSRRQSLSSTSMVLNAESFRQAVKRSGYLAQLQKSQAHKTQKLQETSDALSLKKQELNHLHASQAQVVGELTSQQQRQEQQQKEMKGLVADLKKQGSALEKELSQRQKRLNELDRELDRIIAEEIRKAEQERLAAERKRKEAEEAERKRQQAAAEKGKADAKVAEPATTAPAKTVAETAPQNSKSYSGTFAQNKGRMLFPVSGECSVVSQFGRAKYADLSRVELDNPGIDIQAPAGSNARAVYPGEVSSIFKLDGYHNIVMVRHGEYLTVYANIDQLAVKKGDKVQAGQHIGKIYSDSSDSNRTILHFEVRKERQKLNPLEWVKK